MESLQECLVVQKHANASRLIGYNPATGLCNRLTSFINGASKHRSNYRTLIQNSGPWHSAGKTLGRRGRRWFVSHFSDPKGNS